jgi:hypothetical protein
MRSVMNKQQIQKIRRTLAKVDQTTAFDLFDELLVAVEDRLIRSGTPRESELIDRLVSVAATKAFGKSMRIGQPYFEARGLWHTTFALEGCRVWLLYDEVAERGLAVFAQHERPLHEWFHVIARADLPTERHAVA